MNIKRNILVTGGAGYIGSLMVKNLLDHDFVVTVFDNLENGHLDAVDKRARFIKGDMGDLEALDAVFSSDNIDAVIDFAAYIAVGESMENPKKYINNNVFNFINLLETMSKFNCRYLIKSSTAAVYGEPTKASDLPFIEDYVSNTNFDISALLEAKWEDKLLKGQELFERVLEYYDTNIKDNVKLKLSPRETACLKIPTSIYGLTKLIDEIIMTKYNNINSVTLRYFNVCGANKDGTLGEDHPAETHLIPRLIRNCLYDEKFQLMGTDYQTKDGTTVRDYIHVLDLVTGHLKALSYLLETGKSDIFNLGTGHGYTVFEIIKTVENIIGKKISYLRMPRRSGDPAMLYSNPNKAKRILGWKSKYKLRDMIESAYQWHRQHPEGYGNNA